MKHETLVLLIVVVLVIVVFVVLRWGAPMSHRDIKPENFTPEQARALEWLVARRRRALWAYWALGMFFGTVISLVLRLVLGGRP